MKIGAQLIDELGTGLDDIRRQFKVAGEFPAEALDEAAAAAKKTPADHVDRTDTAFVTLDPAASTDLDQALCISSAGDDLLLHYAIADVAWFVADGGALDAEAWRRGTTQYLPDAKASLYPPQLSEGAASLLPDGPRPAVVFMVRVDPSGVATLAGAERAIIRSRAKLAYDSVQLDDLPKGFAELATRIEAAERSRGASRVEPPEQIVESTGDGGYQLEFRPRLWSEAQNAALSLATNLAVADALYAAGTGLFRVMPEPDERAVNRLRHTARAFKLEWPKDMPLNDFERTLDAAKPADAAFMMAIRRAGGGAQYVPFDAQHKPWHSAMAATYAHSTAPLRRLADRYVVQAALAVANGQPVPDAVQAAFVELPEVMDRADDTGSQIERAVIDLAEAALVANRVGQKFEAVVTDIDDRGARMQLCDVPLVTRITARGVEPGEQIRVKLTSVDLGRRVVEFSRVN
jgi:VacB/RNase II family 3'-5' exoribonuclease